MNLMLLTTNMRQKGVVGWKWEVQYDKDMHIFTLETSKKTTEMTIKGMHVHLINPPYMRVKTKMNFILLNSFSWQIGSLLVAYYFPL